MAVDVRRVITGHDEAGKAVVTIDDVSPYVTVNRPNIRVIEVWSSHLPPANDEPGDCAERISGTVMPGGAIFRVIEFEPGVGRRVHRTDTMDCITVISGEIDMELEDGREVHLKAGDVMVQRGTVHNWVNRGTESCVCSLVIMAAAPITIGGETLTPYG
jgi:quercetin dioxygenase-like cupin family protein